jgi:hypothetical protein
MLFPADSGNISLSGCAKATRGANYTTFPPIGKGFYSLLRIGIGATLLHKIYWRFTGMPIPIMVIPPSGRLESLRMSKQDAVARLRYRLSEHNLICGTG